MTSSVKALMKLKRREDLHHDQSNDDGPSVLRSPKRRTRAPLESKEEFTRKKLADMNIDDLSR